MLEATHLIVDVFELPVAVRVLCPFAGLAICQQTIPLVSGKFSDRFLFAWRVCLTA